MKTRLIIIVILVLILTVLLTRNDERITNVLLNVINPIKQNYKSVSQEVENVSHSYLFQKESIEKLGRENRILRKRLLEQTHYMQQIQNIYAVLPKLSRLPIHSISISETISYVKLNSFSQLILTKPKKLKKDKLYGLIQGKVVAGVANLHNNQLYGYLTSDEKCRFSVFVGEDNAPGIAMGEDKNKMIIKFIPKWYKIKKGDKVVTSGLDDIFFGNVPVGIVTKIELQSSYKVAYIQTYSDIYHPKTFFLVNDAKASITEGFDSKATRLKPFRAVKSIYKDINISAIYNQEHNTSTPLISSIPSRIDQTQEVVIEPDIPAETPEIVRPKKVKKRQKQRQRQKKTRYKERKKKETKASSLDLF